MPAPVDPTRPAAIKFAAGDGFLRELKKRVDAWFEQTGRRRRDCPQMYLKTATLLGTLAAVYLLLLLVVHAWWLVVPLAVLLGLAMAGVGFNVQHDGGHGAYSEHRWVNRAMAATLDLLGRSSYVWHWKHNAIHHTYTNITGHDDDIDLGFMGRLSPHQKHYPFHRLQGLYLWVLYGFIVIKWHFFDDFYFIVTGKLGAHGTPRPKGRDLLLFAGGKLVFFSLAFVLPALLHPFWSVLAVYAIAAFVSGVVLSVVFQLAHCVEEAQFPMPVQTSAGARMGSDWAVHEVQTTVDFARRSRVLSWLLGGLNYQVEHHLFHKICHIHYPALSKVVEQACREFGIRYAAHESFLGARRLPLPLAGAHGKAGHAAGRRLIPSTCLPRRAGAGVPSEAVRAGAAASDGHSSHSRVSVLSRQSSA